MLVRPLCSSSTTTSMLSHEASSAVVNAQSASSLRGHLSKQQSSLSEMSAGGNGQFPPSIPEHGPSPPPVSSRPGEMLSPSSRSMFHDGREEDHINTTSDHA